MIVKFRKVVLHNFLSYGHSEIDLEDKGYCLVRGENHCPVDRAVSNGSGKSSWISAICYALTGETIQGVTKDIKNIYIDEDLCYVKLNVDIDNDEYELTRYNKPKSDLKIVINGEDKSGKSIRDSELILSQYLPDITKDLLSSVIILGQGLPNKLTSLSPSMMKQRLEQLSKSDFMIEDVKNRVTSRLDEINSHIRETENYLIELNTKNNVYIKQLESYKNTLRNISERNFDSDINNLQTEINRITENIQSLNNEYKNKTDNKNSLDNKYADILDRKQQELDKESTDYQYVKGSLIEDKATVEAEIKSLNDKIKEIKAIKDVCPTCHQRLPGVIKPSTEKEEERLKEINNKYDDILDRIRLCDESHNSLYNNIVEKYSDELNSIKESIDSLNSDMSKILTYIDELKSYNLENEKKLSSLNSDKNNYMSRIDELNNSISETENFIEITAKDIAKYNDDKSTMQKHLDVVNKMNTLIKREFRGYLLSNVISFIDKKCKEYANDVLGSSELDFILDGNNIEIRYCNKQYESLSGGEKQKVDLIVQFSIRDMLSTYLNFSSNILVLDEIFDNLDSTGVSNVVNMISKRFQDIESIFIISHHSDELEIQCDNEMTIIKNERGISEVK